MRAVTAKNASLITHNPLPTLGVVPFALLRYARRMNEDSKVDTEVRGAPLSREQRSRCLNHAGNLIAAAERVLADDNAYPNIAYHLAILAMEEIGKAGMLASRAVIGAALDCERLQKRFDDHVQADVGRVVAKHVGRQNRS